MKQLSEIITKKSHNERLEKGLQVNISDRWLNITQKGLQHAMFNAQEFTKNQVLDKAVEYQQNINQQINTLAQEAMQNPELGQGLYAKTNDILNNDKLKPTFGLKVGEHMFEQIHAKYKRQMLAHAFVAQNNLVQQYNTERDILTDIHAVLINDKKLQKDIKIGDNFQMSEEGLRKAIHIFSNHPMSEEKKAVLDQYANQIGGELQDTTYAEKALHQHFVKRFNTPEGIKNMKNYTNKWQWEYKAEFDANQEYGAFQYGKEKASGKYDEFKHKCIDAFYKEELNGGNIGDLKRWTKINKFDRQNKLLDTQYRLGLYNKAGSKGDLGTIYFHQLEDDKKEIVHLLPFVPVAISQFPKLQELKEGGFDALALRKILDKAVQKNKGWRISVKGLNGRRLF